MKSQFSREITGKEVTTAFHGLSQVSIQLIGLIVVKL